MKRYILYSAELLFVLKEVVYNHLRNSHFWMVTNLCDVTEFMFTGGQGDMWNKRTPKQVLKDYSVILRKLPLVGICFICKCW